MTKFRDAVALRAFSHADDNYEDGQVILRLDAGHFDDWSAVGVDLVRAATDEEVDKAKGEPVAPKAKAVAKRKARPAPRAKPAPVSPAPEPAAEASSGA